MHQANNNEISTTPTKLFLLVNDNSVDRAQWRSLITSTITSAEFIETEHCQDAAELLKTQTPYCCLIKQQRPLQDNITFIKNTQQLDIGKVIPVIVLADQSDEKLAVDIMRNGAQDYLSKKDINKQSLLHSINNAVHACELQNDLRYLAHYDSLTGLLNRNLFLDRLQNTIAHCNRYQQSCSLLYIDVDNFKHINDRYGHDAGDTLLKTVGQRIKQSCRLTDSAARLGGDEFAILLERIDETNSKTTAAKILQQVSEPILWESHIIQVSLSIGVAYYPNTANNIHDLMRQADEAMYQAKRSGKDNYCLFTQEQKQQWDRRNYLESLLPAAIDHGELRLAYQPIVHAQDQSLYSFEVLIRWEPQGFYVSATELIEMIDHLNLFDPFHTWLIDSALKQFHLWRQDSGDLHFCLNIPANKCHSDLVVTCLRKALTRYQINPAQIELEITETTLRSHPGVSHALLRSLQQEGVRIAIDDFGAGYSSLAHLTQLPIDTLKIDQQFFIGMESDDRNRSIVEAVTALGHSLGLKVVAEGVESESQYNMAKNIGCDFIQGFYFGRPEYALSNWAVFCQQFPTLHPHIKKHSAAI